MKYNKLVYPVYLLLVSARLILYDYFNNRSYDIIKYTLSFTEFYCQKNAYLRRKSQKKMNGKLIIF